VYFIFALINLLSFSPIAGSEDPDDIATIREPDRQDAAFHPPEAVVPLLAAAVRTVFRQHAVGIRKGKLRHGERNVVLVLIIEVFRRVPLEPGLSDAERLTNVWQYCHISVCNQGERSMHKMLLGMRKAQSDAGNFRARRRLRGGGLVYNFSAYWRNA